MRDESELKFFYELQQEKKADLLKQNPLDGLHSLVDSYSNGNPLALTEEEFLTYRRRLADYLNKVEVSFGRTGFFKFCRNIPAI